MKKKILSRIIVLVMFASMSPLSYAQTIVSILPGANKDGILNGPNYPLFYLKQANMSSPWSAGSCVGANEYERLYLNGDLDGDGLKDLGGVRYLYDNYRFVGGGYTNVRRIDASSETSLYTPSNASNVFSIRHNNQTYSAQTNNVWFRASRVAPKGEYVKAFTSEPILFEQPSTNNPADGVFQVSYVVKWSDYASRGSSSASTSARTYPSMIVSNQYAAGPISYRYIDSVPFTVAGLGPIFSSDYMQTAGPASHEINRDSTINSHSRECATTYLSWCGNGYQEVSGQQPTNGSSTLPTVVSTPNVAEACDPGTPGVTSPYLPAGSPQGYTCNASCQLVPGNSGSPDIKIDKRQSYNAQSTGIDNGRGNHVQPATMNYILGGQFTFTIKVGNLGTAPATNVTMEDTLPQGFVFVSCTNNNNTTCTYNAATHKITSAPFSLGVNQDTIFTVIGTLTNSSNTTNTASALLGGVVKDTDYVTQQPQPIIPPNITIQKFQGTSANNITNTQSTNNPLQISTSNDLWYILRINNTGGPATNVVLTDNFDADLGVCSYQGITPSLAFSPSVSLGQTLPDPWSITFPTLPAGTYDVKIKCVLSNKAGGTVFANNFTLTQANNSPSNTVAAQIPALQSPNMSITKYQRVRSGVNLNHITTTNLQGASPAYTQNPLTGAVGNMIDYRLQIKNIGAGSAQLSSIIDNAINTGIPGLNCPLVGVSNFYYIDPTSLLSSVYKVPNVATWTFNPALTLQTNTEVNIYYSCSITSTQSQYVNHGSMAWSTGGATITTPSNSVVVTPPAVVSPILSLTKLVRNQTVTPNGAFVEADNATQGVMVPATPGDQIRYIVRVTNTGGPVTQAVQISDTLPSHVTVSSVLVPGQTAYTPTVNTNNQFTITIPASAFANTNTVDVELYATLSANAPANVSFGNNVMFLGGVIDADNNAINNSARIGTPGVPDLVIDKQWISNGTLVDSMTVYPNQNISFQLTVTNIGSASTTLPVTIQDACPTGLNCTSYVFNGTTYPITNNSFQSVDIAPANGMLPQQSGFIIVNATVASNAPVSLTNTGAVYHGSTREDDDPAYLTIGALTQNFSITKTATGSLTAGQITYSFYFCNTATGVSAGTINTYTLHDPLPGGMTYVLGTNTSLFYPNSVMSNPITVNPVVLNNNSTLDRHCNHAANNLPSSSCALAPGSCHTLRFSVTQSL